MPPASLLSAGGEEVVARGEYHFASSSNVRTPSHSWSDTAMGQQHIMTTRTSQAQYSDPANPPVDRGHTANSPRGMFRVNGYYPSEGSVGSSITVAINCSVRTSHTIFLRIIVGRQAVTTTVLASAGQPVGVWELQATIPPLEDSITTVPLSVQALNGSSDVLDSLIFGQFTYSGYPPHSIPAPVIIKRDESEDVPIDFPPPASRSANSYDADAVRSSGASGSRSRRSRGVQPPRSFKKQAVLRTTGRALPRDASAQLHQPLLELVTPLESMCKGWDEEELNVGRRLIRFSRRQEGYKLIVSCERIKQKEYYEGDIVISCIYRADTDSCFVTSVDIIFLLESLVGEGFDIEEKNRIRRNLEGFRPKTVSKNRIGSEDFFQQIMDFPTPKPRNIEKDLKVFDWKVLPQALEKIISKYSIYPTPIPDAVKMEYANISIPEPLKLEYPSISPQFSTSTSSLPLTPETPSDVSSPLESPTDFITSQPAIADPSPYQCVAPETVYTSQLYINHSDPNARLEALHHPEQMPYLACPTPLRSYMSFDTHASTSNTSGSGSGSNASELSYPSEYDSPATAGASQHALYHSTGISPSQAYSTPEALDMGPDMATFDSVEFETLREHNTAIADSYAI